MDTSDVTRFEIIDHTPCDNCIGTGRTASGEECEDCVGMGCKNRQVMFSNENKQVDVDLQDNGQTLKVFIHERYTE